MNIPVLTKFLPKTLDKISSPINGEIFVVEQFGKKKLVIGGLTQSGPMAEEIWGRGLEYSIFDVMPNSFRHPKRIQKLVRDDEPLNILILGLGGGSLVKLLNQYFPQAKITGIEIDPIMVKLGRQYLDLASAKNLKIVIEDANVFLQKRLNDELFNLIFVDMYLGDRVPEFLENEIFLRNLKNLLTKNGIVVFNRLYYKNHIFTHRFFLDKLAKIFDDLNSKKIISNILIFARR